jgi:hypothetical protein
MGKNLFERIGMGGRMIYVFTPVDATLHLHTLPDDVIFIEQYVQSRFPGNVDWSEIKSIQISDEWFMVIGKAKT